MTTLEHLKAQLCASGICHGGPIAAGRPRDECAIFALLDRHKRRFAIAPSPALAALEDFMERARPDLIEPSIEVAGPRVYPARCNLYYGAGQLPRIIDHVFGFADHVADLCGGSMNAEPLAELVSHGLRVEHCRGVMLGLAMKPDLQDIELEVLFVLRDESAALAPDLCAAVGVAPPPPRPIVDMARLFGASFRMDGTSRPKIYSGLPAADYEMFRRYLQLGDRAMRLIHCSPFCLAQLGEGDAPIQLLLYGRDIFGIIEHDVVQTLHYDELYVLAAYPREVEDGLLQRFELYYAYSESLYDISYIY